jgi:hypothetical protein
LLVVGVDVAEGTTVTFDSYEKGKDLNGEEIGKTVYKDASKKKNQ